MKLFECEFCQQPVYFDNTVCVSCGHRLGYRPQQFAVGALEPDGDAWRALGDPERIYVFCANAEYDACNWLIPQGDKAALCAACHHNATVPDLTVPENLTRWRKLEAAKHHLFYSLMRWKLPTPDRLEDPDRGLAFEFLSDTEGASATPVLTGHNAGMITINIAEANDPEREARRTAMQETYRTLLGHFRHEIGHYFWDRLVLGTPHLAGFRELFGDETRDYGTALHDHYEAGPPANWRDSFITSYASAHPWEDFAECWAHYIHIVDSLETASAFRIRIRPRVSRTEELRTRIDFDSYNAPLSALIEAWVPMTIAINSVNRSMGQPDLYPFVLSPPVITKINFIHDLVQACASETRPVPASRD